MESVGGGDVRETFWGRDTHGDTDQRTDCHSLVTGLNGSGGEVVRSDRECLNQAGESEIPPWT